MKISELETHIRTLKQLYRDRQDIQDKIAALRQTGVPQIAVNILGVEANIARSTALEIIQESERDIGKRISRMCGDLNLETEFNDE